MIDPASELYSRTLMKSNEKDIAPISAIYFLEYDSDWISKYNSKIPRADLATRMSRKNNHVNVKHDVFWKAKSFCKHYQRMII